MPSWMDVNVFDADNPAEGRADRAELGWDGERAHADALRTRIGRDAGADRHG